MALRNQDQQNQTRIGTCEGEPGQAARYDPEASLVSVSGGSGPSGPPAGDHKTSPTCGTSELQNRQRAGQVLSRTQGVRGEFTVTHRGRTGGRHRRRPSPPSAGPTAAAAGKQNQSPKPSKGQTLNSYLTELKSTWFRCLRVLIRSSASCRSGEKAGLGEEEAESISSWGQVETELGHIQPQ